MKYSLLFLSLLPMLACQDGTTETPAGNTPPVTTMTLHERARPAQVKEALPEEVAAAHNQDEIQSEPLRAQPRAGSPSSGQTDKAREARPSKLPSPSTENIASPSHQAWDALLRKHVSSSGKADYKGFLADKGKLQAYLDELAASPPGKSWNRNEQLAYWINAYNAFTIKLILDNYPVSSITEIHGGKPWDVKWIKLGDKSYSLNNIENDIIRPKFQEPRIHFAVNCAARSCPPLLNRAFTADNLNRYLEQQARSFINNPKYNEISPDAVKISKIFEWYAGDFGNIIDYLNRYSETRIREKASVQYKEYDWGLNEGIRE